MKKILIAALLILAIACMLSACKFPDPNTIVTIEGGYLVVNGDKTEYESRNTSDVTIVDGYLYVNGEKTGYKFHIDPAITIIDGYLALNGVKTEYEVKLADHVYVDNFGYLVVNDVTTKYKIYTDPVISVIDGYVAVNGVKTEYEVNTPDEIYILKGYLHVNGVKTPYMIKFTCEHKWQTTTTAPTCTEGGYDEKTCAYCKEIVRLNPTEAIGHTFSTLYSTDNDSHWYACSDCDEKKEKTSHDLDENGVCTICLRPTVPTPGVIYGVSADGTYAEVMGYTGTASSVKFAEEYNGLPVKNIYWKSLMNNKTISFVVIPDGVTSIGTSAFSGCSSLTTVVIPDSVTSIGNGAFENCSNLTSIVIPDNVTSIGKDAFSGCDSLTITEYQYGKYLKVGNNPYAILIGLTNENMRSYTLHERTTIIANNVFSSCSRLLSITIPDSVTRICASAFEGCTTVNTVVLSNSLKTIGDYAFRDCRALTSIVIPDSVVKIGDWAFYSCSSLASAVIGTRVTSIGLGAFAYCEALSTAVIPSGVTSLDNYTFSNCTSLKSIIIPDCVTSIGSYAFTNCHKLSNVYFGGSAAQWGAIDLAVGNNYLTAARIQYNYISEK